MKNTKTTFLLFLLATSNLLAEGGGDFMRSTGKIYVVIAVIVVMFLGIVLFLINLDKKISHIEKQLKNDE